MDRFELAGLFEKGAKRKMEEREMFSLRSMDDPDRAELYGVLADYADVDERYYIMASLYYRGDLDALEDGRNDDLLLLLSASELPPKTYAAYLREIPKGSREEEKVTHRALMQLKSSIRAELLR